MALIELEKIISDDRRWMEWRYNNRDKELYSLLIDCMLGVGSYIIT